MCLDGILDRIRVPFLVTHGERIGRSRSRTPTARSSNSSTRRVASSKCSRLARAASSTSAPTT
jgi:hypothetical protein